MVRYVRDNFFRPLNTKLAADGQTVDIATANEQVAVWRDTVAHQRIHDTTKEKPAQRLAEKRKVLQPLPPELLPVPPLSPRESEVPCMTFLSQHPLHHDLSIYDQLTGAL